MLHKTLAIVDKDMLNKLIEIESTMNEKQIELYRDDLITILLEQKMPRLQKTYEETKEGGTPQDAAMLHLQLKVLRELEVSLIREEV